MQQLKHAAKETSPLQEAKQLHLRNNNLTSLEPFYTLLNLITAFTDLDVRRNTFFIFHFWHCLQVKLLRILNIYNSGVREANSFVSVSLREPDLSCDSLEVFDNQLQTLRRMNLSDNHVINLHFLGNLL